MVGPDTSLTGGILAAFTLLGINWGLNPVTLKWTWLNKGIIGHPTLLIHHGEFVEQNYVPEQRKKKKRYASNTDRGVGGRWNG